MLNLASDDKHAADTAVSKNVTIEGKITALEQAPFGLEGRRMLALIYNKIGATCSEQKNWPKAVEWYEKANTSLEQVPPDKRTLEDWRKLAEYQNNLGETYSEQKDWVNTAKCYEKASISLTKIPLLECTRMDWHAIASYHSNVANAYYYLNRLEESENRRLLAIQTITKITHKTADDYKLMGEYFQESVEYYTSSSQQFFDFASSVFLDDDTTPQSFEVFYRDILNLPAQQFERVSKYLLVFMVIVVTGCHTANFPASPFKQYLADEKNLKEFHDKLMALKTKQESLVALISDSPVLTLALAQQNQLLQKENQDMRHRINNLEEKVQLLVNNHKRLREKAVITEETETANKKPRSTIAKAAIANDSPLHQHSAPSIVTPPRPASPSCNVPALSLPIPPK